MKIKLQKRVIIPSVILIALIGLCLWAASSLSETVRLNEALTHQSQILAQQNRKDYRKILQQVKDISLAKKATEEQKRDALRWKKVAVIYKHYRDAGTLYQCPWITPEHLYHVIVYGEKYRPLAPNYYWDYLDGENMFLCWCSNGMNFNPKGHYKNTNGTYDSGICDINDCHSDLFADKGKGGDKFDTEKSVEAWYKWLNAKRGYSCWMMWARFRTDVKDLYFKLRAVN
jgi:hypothetical protein